MSTRQYLFFGLAIPIVFVSAILILASFVDGYNHVTQTISEIGENGSPMELPWKIANLTVAACFLFFSVGIYQVARLKSTSTMPAYFVGYFGLVFVGLSIFESPHPLHNVFGVAMIFGYLAPLVVCLTWKKYHWSQSVVKWSWVVLIFIIFALALNLYPAFNSDTILVEYYGLVQRSLFVVYHGWWCILMSLQLLKMTPTSRQ